MPAKLKVFRTSIGFSDAYVAAPSRKAALAAWGTTKDLFARGAAEEVTDPELMAEALARPGTVVRRSRGSLAAHVKALGPSPARSPQPPRVPAGDEPPKPLARPRPRPSRTRLDKAEAALRAHVEATAAEIEALRDRERKLARDREALTEMREKSAFRLRETVREEELLFRDALARWQPGG